MLWNEAVSKVLGYFSIGCWLIVFAPQIYENYQRKSGEGISLLFLYIWILGDLFGLIGAVQQDLIVTALILYIYYFVADAILLAQIHYYSYVNKRAGRLDDNGEARALTTATAHVTVTTTYSSSSSSPSKAAVTKIALVIMGYVSALLFLGARIPQIVKNYRKKSCEGLSIGMFIFSILGNVSFTLSLLLYSLDNNYILANIPWIIGSTGTLFFDLGIFYQFYLYHGTEDEYESDCQSDIVQESARA
ncbi:PQ-loop-domain-containing protein [Martensiomyces pterosporus]|nr:PQ-loop-domain-containing protein [Martensiomyces pterosporus]